MKFEMKKELGIFVLLLVVCAVVSVLNPKFLSAVNLQNTSNQIGMYGIFAMGLGFVIITGGIDLSVGSAMALLGVLLSIASNDRGLPLWVSIGLVLVVGALLGSLHGLLITRAHLQPFIVTLCGLLFYRGMARFISSDETKGFSNTPGFEQMSTLVTSKPLGVPFAIWLMLIIAAIMWVVLHRSVYGRHLFAVGRSEEAARYSGVDTRRVITIAYVICSVLTAVAAVLFVFYTPSISPANHAASYELYGIAAAVLGGCSLRGGEGSIIGILIGAALLRVLQNLLILLGITSSLEFAIIGTVFLLGVLADQLLKNRAAKRPKAITA
ncbi:MAG: ribose transport system permease protein [Abditibacteriota bacterium]|nr:ribose transport system permease protein [Abditibacteriota bacterium]